MLLKLADKQDFNFILGAAQKLHEDFKGVEFDRETTKDTIDAFLNGNLEESMLVVAFEEDKYVGVVAGMVSLTPFSTKKIAIEPLFWTNGSYKAFKSLHKAFITWADKVGADAKVLAVPPTKEFSKWERFYTKLGYRAYEHSFIKEGRG